MECGGISGIIPNSPKAKCGEIRKTEISPVAIERRERNNPLIMRPETKRKKKWKEKEERRKKKKKKKKKKREKAKKEKKKKERRR